MDEKELEAFTEFLNDIEEVAEKHGYNIGMYENSAKTKTLKELK